MATSNADRVARALELVRVGLAPFIERELKAAYGARWNEEVAYVLRDNKIPVGQDGRYHFDVTALLAILLDRWHDVFRNALGANERTLAMELRGIRNRWAHQEPFNTDDTYRALDTMQRLLQAVSAGEQAAEIDRQKTELMRTRYEEQARREIRKAAVAPVEGQPAGGLRPWREIVTPHPDVASGNYQQAEFAADLGQVHRGEASAEYGSPRDFFQRTFLTEGLRHLLTTGLQRLAHNTGDPVVELQTNFGGGKTHSMLALYHLVSGTPASDLAGIEPVLEAAAVTQLPTARRAVLVGTELSPGQPRQKRDGTIIHTLWGELAWQLLGKDGYAHVAEADRTGTSPGSEALRELFAAASPCLILIDEWVAYVRQLYGVSGLSAGSFDANLTFAQALTEAAKAAPRTLLVASIPQSDIEIGGEGGREAVARLRNVFSRVDAVWRPASAEEGFEIVRRRLFQPITDARLFAARDAVAKAFCELYRTQAAEFPAATREADYERRLKAAYPIHPELFDRLYNDWAHLDRFQRTRGVLRLMSAVIHALWERQDGNLLILPATVPIDDPAVQFELTRYLEDPWIPIIERDVDGAHSLPLRLDREHPNLGRLSASRRVARTIYLGSAPTLHTASRGIEEHHIKLGCVQPGESVAIFGDALRRLTEQANHLYVQEKRYWYSTQASVSRLAQDRAEQMEAEKVQAEIEGRLRKEQSTRGAFARVHACPGSSGDLPDEREARLVILRPDAPHGAKDGASPALKVASQLLSSRGTSPRYYANTLVFLAPDRTRLVELEQAARQYLAWKEIDEQQETLNLDAFQRHQAKTRRAQADDTVKGRIPETYCWLLVPKPYEEGDLRTSDETNTPGWTELKLQPATDGLAPRAARKLENDGLLYTTFAGTNLRLELDRIPLWRGESVSLKQLAEDFATYLYLPRLADESLLLTAAGQGVASLMWEAEGFAYADSYDEARGRFRGLKTGQQITPARDGLLVRPSAAAAQKAQEQGLQGAPISGSLAASGTPTTAATTGPMASYAYPPIGGAGAANRAFVGESAPAQRVLRRFYGSAPLDAIRAERDATQIIKEVIQHLTSQLGAQVTLSLEIKAFLPEGAPEHVVRTVTENCRTLKFTTFGFEEE